MRSLFATLCFLAAAFILSPSKDAEAQYFPCPSFTAGWTVSGPAPITSVAYDQQTQILSVVWYGTQPTQYYPVPLSVMQTFYSSNNFLATFSAYVAPTYHPIWLQEKSNCPVLQDGGGYIWTQ